MKRVIRGYGRKTKEPDFPVLCTYCGGQAEKVYGKDIAELDNDSARHLADTRYYYCRRCPAYVATHKGTWIPHGTLADRDTRRARMEAHEEFDKLWKDGYMTRSDAYKWLSEKMGLQVVNCHIGFFTEEQCKQTIRACREFLKSKIASLH